MYENFDLELLLELVAQKQFRRLKEILSEMNEVDVAEFMDEVEEDQKLLIFRLLPRDMAAEVFSYMEDSEDQEKLINALSDKELREVLDELYLDDTVDIIEDMPANVVSRNDYFVIEGRRRPLLFQTSGPGLAAGVQQPLAPGQHVPPGGLEVVREPGVRYIAGAVGVVHQQVHLAAEVAAADAGHIAQVGPVHPDQQVVFLIIAAFQLPGGLTGAVDPVLSQLAPRRRIDRVADLLGAGSSGFDVKLGLQSGFFRLVLNHNLGLRAAAYIAVADKKDACHHSHSP